MKLNMQDAEIYLPGNTELETALKRTTHLAISAHQDDIEIMGYDGVIKCYEKEDDWFTGVVVTNGSGSPRAGIYKNYTDDKMMEVRKKEQKEAARIGKYSAQFLLDYPSSEVKNKNNINVIEDIKAIVLKTKPKVVYTHNLADKHDTHVAVCAKVISALRELSKEELPEKLYGCEAWRNLDWLCDEDKIKFDVSGNSNLELDLIKVFDSQIAGGKKYDLATMGRRLANATFSNSHEVDTTDSMIYAMDLTPLILDKSLNTNDYIKNYIQKFSNDIENKISLFF